MLIRPATDPDLPAVAAIYDHEVAHRDRDLRPRAAAARVVGGPAGQHRAGDHLLVAEQDGEVLGYAYSSSYRPRRATAHTRETSIYLADDAQGQGLGRRMYDDLLDRLVADGMHLALAVIALPNPASVALHRAFGFEEVGVMREVGREVRPLDRRALAAEAARESWYGADRAMPNRSHRPSAASRSGRQGAEPLPDLVARAVSGASRWASGVDVLEHRRTEGAQPRGDGVPVLRGLSIG